MCDPSPRWPINVLRASIFRKVRGKKSFSLKMSVKTYNVSEPEFYGDLVYKFKKIMGRTDFFRSY